MTQFKAPFTLSRLKVGLHILQGCWYEIKDANKQLVCTIPAERRRGEEAIGAQMRLDSHTQAVIDLLNRGAV